MRSFACCTPCVRAVMRLCGHAVRGSENSVRIPQARLEAILYSSGKGAEGRGKGVRLLDDEQDDRLRLKPLRVASSAEKRWGFVELEDQEKISIRWRQSYCSSAYAKPPCFGQRFLIIFPGCPSFHLSFNLN